MIVGLDFDGTIVEHLYPSIGEDLGAFPWLKQAAAIGARFVLFTMRDGAELQAAAKYIRDNGVDLLALNTNPSQSWWTQSPKAYCHLYVDDAGLGIPLSSHAAPGRSFVDWDKAGPLLIERVADWMMDEKARQERAVAR